MLIAIPDSGMVVSNKITTTQNGLNLPTFNYERPNILIKGRRIVRSINLESKKVQKDFWSVFLKFYVSNT